MTIKIGIVGSRNRDMLGDKYKIMEAYQDWLKAYLNDRIYKYGDIQIVSGGQIHGADGYAELIAKDYEYPMHTYHAPWREYGRAAGPIRNTFIARDSDILIAAPSPDSKGTVDCINKFKTLKPNGELILV